MVLLLLKVECDIAVLKRWLAVVDTGFAIETSVWLLFRDSYLVSMLY